MPGARAPTPAETTRSASSVFSTTSAANSPIQLGQDQGIWQANGLEIEMTHAPGNAGPGGVAVGASADHGGWLRRDVTAVAGGGDFGLWLQLD